MTTVKCYDFINLLQTLSTGICCLEKSHSFIFKVKFKSCRETFGFKSMFPSICEVISSSPTFRASHKGGELREHFLQQGLGKDQVEHYQNTHCKSKRSFKNLNQVG